MARKVLAAEVNGAIIDTFRPIEEDATVNLLTWEDEGGKKTFWHSSAHLLAGAIIGEAERVSPYQAIKTITANAAYEFFDEDLKGTLIKGKLADFVILDKNPLKMDAMSIKDIEVVETIKAGKTVYKK